MIIEQNFSDIEPSVGANDENCRCEGGIFRTVILDLEGYDKTTITIDPVTGIMTGITLLPNTALIIDHADPSDLVTGEVASEAISDFSTLTNETFTYNFEVPAMCNDVSRAEDILKNTCNKLVINYFNCNDCCQGVVEGLKIKSICGTTSIKYSKVKATKNWQIGDNTGTSEMTRQWTITGNRNCSELWTDLTPDFWDAAAIA